MSYLPSCQSSLVLIIDDTPTNLSVLTQVLTDAGFEVAIATSGERAIEQINRELPDLILLDIMMPGIGGFETCRRLKANARSKKIPIIFMTALADVGNKVKALELGATDYITKPFNAREVVDRVTIHLELFKTQLQLQQSEERLETVLSSLQEVVWSALLNPFEIVYLNSSIELIYGLSPQSLIDSPHLWIDRIIKADVHLAQRYLLDAPACGSFELEYRVKGSDGKVHWIQCRAKTSLEVGQSRFRVDGILSDVTARKSAERKLFYAAKRDSLTHLANRSYFMDKLTQSLRTYQEHHLSKFALLFIDLDRFKNINDSLGHSIGDDLLVQVSRALVKVVRPTDLVARLGGDEFTILIEGMQDINDVTKICDRIQDVLKHPFKVGEYLLTITASIGVVASSESYDCADEILRDADIAMYEAKKKGKACYKWFSREMYEQINYKLSLENDLGDALEKKQLFLEYQPIINLVNEELVGFEALVRWNHQQLGSVPPSEFVSIAEESNLINQLGSFVFKEACTQMSQWLSLYPQMTDLTISINVSSRQLETEYFLSEVKEVLTQTQLDPKNVKLEITETSLMKDNKNGRQYLSKFKQMGLGVSLDDFGTGYSSLSYLVQFPIDTLKIDRSFINTMEDNNSSFEIIRTITTLARVLGMNVIAEGLEKVSQGLLLKELGCDMVQGYLFSRPLSIEKATQYIRLSRNPILLTSLEIEKITA